MTFGFHDPEKFPEMTELRPLGKRNLKGIVAALRQGVLAEVYEQYERVSALVPKDLGFASFSILGADEERIAVINGFGPTEWGTVAVLHNKIMDNPGNKSSRCMRAAAFIFGKELVSYQLDYLDPADGCWQASAWAPLLDVEEDTLVVTMKANHLQPILSVWTGEKMGGIPRPEQVDMLVDARNTLVRCTEGTRDERVVSFSFRDP